MAEFLVLLVVGLFAGVLAGLLGIGGGIIFTPVLFFMFTGSGVEQPVLWTIASGLFCTFVAAGGSTVRQIIQENFFFRQGLLLGILGSAGIYLGKLVITSSYYQQKEFAIFFSLMLLYAAGMMYVRGRDTTDEEGRTYKDLGIRQSALAGGAGGFIAALAGVGGGGIMVPIMNLYYKIPFRKAVSISQWAMIIMVGGGWIQLAMLVPESGGISSFSVGFVDFGTALPLALGGLVGGFGGAQLNQKIKRRYLQWLFSVIAILMAVRLIWEAFA